MDVKEKNNTEKTNAAAEPVAEDLNEVMRIRREKLAALVAEGKNVVFDVDVVGGINIKKFYGDRALSIFIQPPSVEVLRQRLTDRGTDAPDVIECRLNKAEYELSFASQFDIVIVNDNLEDAQKQALQAIQNFTAH